ncbi:MAG: DUF3108 domain-containing protein [Hyphomicrobiales bacterium]|nr:DUF3108 domain-containing protein [Hyphomicrobiales bacterium]
MPRIRFQTSILSLFAAAAVFGASATVGSEAFADTKFRGFYRVYFAGVKIGKAGVSASLTDTAYTLASTGVVAGVAKFFTDSRGEAKSNGRIVDGRLVSDGYALSITDQEGSNSVNMQIASGNVTGVVHSPPEPFRPDRIPVEPAHLLNVFDPMSAFMGKPKAATGQGVCNRTVSIFDGLQRFDLALSYSRTVQVTAKMNGYSAPAFVCKARYRPISGYRPGREAIQYLQKNRDMEIWIAPLGNSGYYAPFRAYVGTAFGPAVAEAEEFHSETN